MASSRMTVFVAGCLAYCSIFLIRKPLSLIKADLDFDNEYALFQLGLIDFAFLLTYALGQVFLGHIGDRSNVHQTLCLAMILSSAPLMMLFSSFNNFGFFFIMLLLLGICHAPLWPLISRVSLQSFSSEYRNSLLGILISASYIGSIIGTLITVYVQYTYGWIYVYVIPGIINITMGIATLFLFKEPVEVDRNSQVLPNNRLTSSSGIRDYYTNRGVLLISVSIFVVRLVKYTMYMWVPYFLLDEILYAQLDSGLISIAFEGGGVLGSLFFGMFLDKIMGRRAVLSVLICNVLTAIAIKLFHTYCYHIVHAIVWLTIIGFFNCGADSLLWSVATELGENIGSPGGVVGFINGVGSFGAVVEGPLFSILLTFAGWDAAFLLCIILSAAVSTLPLIFYPGIFSTNQKSLR